MLIALFSKSGSAARVRDWTTLTGVGLIVAFLDQLSKQLIMAQVAPDSAIDVVGPFHLINVRNGGVAFGLAQGQLVLVSIVTAAALVAMLVVFARRGGRRLAAVPVGLVLGGALSNLADRIRLGYVTDFLNLPHWPTFNVADSAITVGLVVIAVAMVFTSSDEAGVE